MFFFIFINKGKFPMVEKMSFFKKGIKMPGWQHCSLLDHRYGERDVPRSYQLMSAYEDRSRHLMGGDGHMY